MMSKKPHIPTLYSRMILRKMQHEARSGATINLVTLVIVPLLTIGASATVSYWASRTSTDKDYVNIAVSILNNKDAPKESRQWALRLLNKLSPVPFSAQGNAELVSGQPLVPPAVETKVVKVDVPVAIKPPILVKKGDDKIAPCPDLNTFRTEIRQDQVNQFIRRLSKAYYKCKIKQSFAVSVVDILQGTYNNPAESIAEPEKHH